MQDVCLAIFDLDNTLLSGDSDLLWGNYLCQIGYYADPVAYRAQHAQFYQDYKLGRLNIDAFLAFQLEPFSEISYDQLSLWRSDFIKKMIEPVVLPKAYDLLEQHMKQQHRLVISTATNRFITEPVATLLGVEDLIATELEWHQGRFTGRTVGTLNFQNGKITRLSDWTKEQGINPKSTWFYSDSHNDIPLLNTVTKPVAVDPDPVLRRHAQEHGWDIISLR